jgi:hypothetical protein
MIDRKMQMKHQIIFALFMLCPLLSSMSLGASDADQEWAKALKSCDKLVSSHKIDPVRSKMMPPKSGFTVLQYADNSKPNERELSALKAFFGAVTACHDKMASALHDNFPPAYLSLYQRHWNETGKVYAQLYRGKITYGEAAEFRSDMGEQFQADLGAQYNVDQKQFLADKQRYAAAEQERKRRASELALCMMGSDRSKGGAAGYANCASKVQ